MQSVEEEGQVKTGGEVAAAVVFVAVVAVTVTATGRGTTINNPEANSKGVLNWRNLAAFLTLVWRRLQQSKKSTKQQQQ